MMPDASAPLRVLFLGKSAGRGGMPRELSYLVKHLNNKRFAPLVVLMEGGDLLETYRAHAPTHVYAEVATPIDRHFARWGKLRRILPASYQGTTLHRLTTRWLRGLVDEFAPQLIVRQYHRPSWLFDTLYDLEIPTIQTVLSVGSQLAGIPMAQQERMVQGVEAIVCPGKGVHRYLTHCLNVAPERITTICTGLDLTLRDEQLAAQKISRRDLGFDVGDFVIATAGSLQFLKGADIWVEAAARVIGRYPQRPIKFLWLGGGGAAPTLYERSVWSLAKRLGIERQVVFAGDQEHVYAALQHCDIYVQPSRDDAFPHATMEAMALGKPVVASPQGIALEAGARHALVPIEALTPERIEQGIEFLIEHPEKREQLGRAGLEWIEREYTIEGTMQPYEDLLWQTARRQGSTHAA